MKPPADTDAEPVIEVKNLVRAFGGRTVLHDISFTVHKGETLVIIGASGCGKSTLLRHIIGTMRPTSGSVRIFGQDITQLDEHAMSAIRRRFGMLFQSGALLGSLTIGENIALPIVEHTNANAATVESIVEAKLAQVGLADFGHLKPSEISGGMRKRAGLARALALDPELLFSDEPTSGLDPIMTAVIDKLTRELTQKTGMTAVVVTHDMTSAFRIGSRLLMLGAGRHQGTVIATGTPDEIRNHSDPEVQQFIRGEAEGPLLNPDADDNLRTPSKLPRRRTP